MPAWRTEQSGGATGARVRAAGCWLLSAGETREQDVERGAMEEREAAEADGGEDPGASGASGCWNLESGDLPSQLS